MRKIKKGDKVLVTAGKHKGKVSTVIQVKTIINRRKIENDYVYLDGVNVAKKAVKKQGFKDVILPIHISNVQYYSEEDKKAGKISFVVKDGKKRRYIKKLDRLLEK